MGGGDFFCHLIEGEKLGRGKVFGSCEVALHQFEALDAVERVHLGLFLSSVPSSSWQIPRTYQRCLKTLRHSGER